MCWQILSELWCWDVLYAVKFATHHNEAKKLDDENAGRAAQSGQETNDALPLLVLGLTKRV